MSASEIIAELPHLTIAELHAVEQRIAELTSLKTTGASPDSTKELCAKRIAGRLVLAGPKIVRQSEVESILDEFP